ALQLLWAPLYCLVINYRCCRASFRRSLSLLAFLIAFSSSTSTIPKLPKAKVRRRLCILPFSVPVFPFSSQISRPPSDLLFFAPYKTIYFLSSAWFRQST